MEFASGCDGNLAMVVFGHGNYEEFGSDNSVEWKKVYDKYNEMFGENSYETDINSFSESLEMYEEEFTIWNFYQI